MPDTLDRDHYSDDRSSLKAKMETLSAYDPEWKATKDKLERIKSIDKMIGH